MSTIKNCQILLFSHFNKIIKGPGASSQSPALRQKHIWNNCHTKNSSVSPNFLLMKIRIHKKWAEMWFLLCSNAYNDVTDFEICWFHKKTKISISWGQDIIFLQIKKFTKGYFMTKNSFVADVTFNSSCTVIKQPCYEASWMWEQMVLLYMGDHLIIKHNSFSFQTQN